MLRDVALWIAAIAVVSRIFRDRDRPGAGEEHPVISRTQSAYSPRGSRVRR